jgi:hypothetical protein
MTVMAPIKDSGLGAIRTRARMEEVPNVSDLLRRPV